MRTILVRGFLTAIVVFSLFFFLSLLLFPSPSHAQGRSGPWGFGIMLGEPSALTGKFIADSRVAYDMGLSFSFDRWFLVYGDWLYQVPGAFGRQNAFVARLSPYLGIGGVFIASQRSEYERRGERYFKSAGTNSIALGPRFPLGLEWRPASVPVGVFIELAPGITIVPATTAFFQGGFGARFFF